MHSYWVTFKNYKSGCVEAKDETDAASIAENITGFKPSSVKRLPYPANPRINMHHDAKFGITPSFCFDPLNCCGNTSCPRRYSCTE